MVTGNKGAVLKSSVLLCQRSFKLLLRRRTHVALCPTKQHQTCRGGTQCSSLKMNGALLSYRLEDLRISWQLVDYPC